MSKLASLLEKTFIFTYFLLLPTQTAYHLWVTDSFLFGRKIDYLSPTLYFTQLISLVLLLYWLYQGLLLKSRFSIKTSRSSLILTILLLANGLFSPSPLISLYRLASLFLTALFLFNLHRRFSFTSNLFLVPLSLSLLWTSVLAWAQWFNQSAVGSLFQLLGERPLFLSLASTAKVPLGDAGLILRSYSTFPHPNALAGYLLLISLFLLLGLKKTVGANTRILLTTSFLVSLFTLPLTFSRTAFWALLSLPVIYVWRLPHKPRIIKYGLTAVFLILLIISFFVPGNPSSLYERISQYSHAFSLIIFHPVLGVGLGNYLYFSPASLLQLAHNFWLLFLVEMGWPLSIFVFYKIFLIFKKSLSLNGVSLILIWPLLITSLSDSYWFTLYQTTSAAIFILVYLNTLTSTSPKLPK